MKTDYNELFESILNTAYEKLRKRDEQMRNSAQVGEAHRLLLYVRDSPRFDEALHHVECLPNDFDSVKKAFNDEVQKLSDRCNLVLGNAKQIRADGETPIKAGLVLNRWKKQSQICLPVYASQKENGLQKQVYDFVKGIFIPSREGEFRNYVMLEGGRRSSLDLERQLAALTPALANAKVSFYLYPCAYELTPEKQAALQAPAQIPAAAPLPIAVAADAKPAQLAPAHPLKYSDDIRQYVGELRKQGVLSEDIAKQANEKFGTNMSKGNVMAILAWLTRRPKKAK
jgi:hypothetical protein